MAGFDPHDFSVSTALCDGCAYLLSVLHVLSQHLLNSKFCSICQRLAVISVSSYTTPDSISNFGVMVDLWVKMVPIESIPSTFPFDFYSHQRPIYALFWRNAHAHLLRTVLVSKRSVMAFRTIITRNATMWRFRLFRSLCLSVCLSAALCIVAKLCKIDL